MTLRSCLLFLAACAVTACHAADEDKLRLNQIQVIGTHNSYHAGIAPNEAILWKRRRPDLFAALDYRHPSQSAQMSSGVRQIELDIFADARGGLYAHPAGPGLVAAAGLAPDAPFDPDHLMDKPGFKVMHVQDVDYRSVCQPLVACLAEVRGWSRAHPDHLPIFILLETKEKPIELDFPTVQPEPFTDTVFDALDAEIASVFSPGEMVTPDDVRGVHPTLPEAIAKDGWPTLAQSRGKIVLLLDQKAAGPVYLINHPALAGRLIFTNAEPGAADAAFVEQNESDRASIDGLVRQGYLVRTRTDADTAQARANDTRRRDEVLGSGAQILSTDYPMTEPAPTGYVVALPGGAVARCNPVLAPKGCRSDHLRP
jgi:hypothetical protein